jgi:hypothetical protein
LPACRKYAAPTTPIHTTRLPAITRFAPIRCAIRPSNRAPPNAANCTIRMADNSVELLNANCFCP